MRNVLPVKHSWNGIVSHVEQTYGSNKEQPERINELAGGA